MEKFSGATSWTQQHLCARRPEPMQNLDSLSCGHTHTVTFLGKASISLHRSMVVCGSFQCPCCKIVATFGEQISSFKSVLAGYMFCSFACLKKGSIQRALFCCSCLMQQHLKNCYGLNHVLISRFPLLNLHCDC